MLFGGAGTVDIGTEWNLKEYRKADYAIGVNVDIGTEWNLKHECDDN